MHKSMETAEHGMSRVEQRLVLGKRELLQEEKRRWCRAGGGESAKGSSGRSACQAEGGGGATFVL